MVNTNTLMQGLVLLVAGMGIVYVFLALMVWVMNRARDRLAQHLKF